MKVPTASLLTVILLGTTAMAQTSGDAELSLWQIQYTAPTRYADGYTVKGKAKTFRGSFRFENGRLLSLEGSVPIASLSSGLESRDASIRGLLFETNDKRLPDLAFKAEASDCTQEADTWLCQVKGSFRIRDEWQAVAVTVHVGNYQGRPWLHAEGRLSLAGYNFYSASSEALKVADRIDVVLDLLGKSL